MTSKLLLALVIALSGQVLYHACQKSVTPGMNPVLALVVFYLVAALATLPLLFIFPITDSVSQQLASTNWAVIGVGISIVLIEVGFLLAYRAGGELSSAFVLTSAAVACSLLIIGVALHGESVSVTKIAGLVMAVAGIYLISRQ
jgi:drug/metabolite transporter (DMT)-like permease